MWYSLDHGSGIAGSSDGACWLIAAQVEQKRSGKIDPLAGNLDSRSDGLIWTRTDFQSDFTHPSTEGERKVGALLLSLLKNDPTARPWFLAEASSRRRRAVRKS